MTSSLLAVLLTASLGAEPAVIRVDDLAVPASTLTERAQDLKRRGLRFTDAALIDSVVNEALLASEAMRTGAALEPDAKVAVQNERMRVLAAALLDREVSSNIKPPEGLVRELYHSTADTVRLKLVVLETETEARAVRARLDHGGEIELEAARSLDPSSSARKGDTGEIIRGQLPADMAEVAFRAPLGSFVGPVQYGPGWAVARVMERTVGDDAGLAAKRTSLESYARAQITEQAKQHFLKIIREREKLTVDEAFLDGLGPRVEPTGAEADHVLATVRGQPVRYRDVLPNVRQMGGGAAGSHGSGSAVKKQVASRYVDERLLAALAVERRLDRMPEVAAALARAEQIALARIMIDRIRAAQHSGAAAPEIQKAVDAQVAALRSRATVQIDLPRANAAIEAGR